MQFIRCLFFLLTLSFLACTTDPVIPVGGVQLPPPVEDPGEANLCADGVISFQHQVLPIMVSSCAYSGCHDVATAAEGVVLDVYERIIKEVDTGNPDNSELYEYISVNDPEDIMPPPPASPLTAEQILIIKNWILQGAENTDCGLACDSTQSSFAADIYPVMQDYCIGCHSDSRQDGNVNLMGYDNVKTYADNGQLVGTMKHDALYAPMPPSGSKLSICRISKVEKWIAEGSQNN